jgi:2-aminobenzoate-CoA ligase
LLLTIDKYKATQCYTAPTMYRQMALLVTENPNAFQLKSLKHTVSAGEALPDATRQLWKRATGIEMTDGIGGTEVIHIYIASAGKDWRRHAGSGAMAVKRKNSGRRHASRASWHTPDASPCVVPRAAATWTTHAQTDYVKDGWNLPGDTFVMDADGYFSYLGAQRRHDRLGGLRHRRP